MLDALPHRRRRLHRDVGEQRAGVADGDSTASRACTRACTRRSTPAFTRRGTRVTTSSNPSSTAATRSAHARGVAGRRGRRAPAARAARRARPPPRRPATARRPRPARRRRRWPRRPGRRPATWRRCPGRRRPGPGRGPVGQQRDQRVGDGQGALAGEGRRERRRRPGPSPESTNERSSTQTDVRRGQMPWTVSPCLRLPALAGGPAALEQVHRHPLGRLGEGGVTAAVAAGGRRRGRRGRLLLRLQVLERRRRHPRLPVLVEVAHDVGQPVRRGALGQVDGDDVGVHVHARRLAGGEQPAGQLGGRARAEGVGRRPEVLVAHARQRPVELEAHDTRRRARLLRDRDHLTHGPERTRAPALRSAHPSVPCRSDRPGQAPRRRHADRRHSSEGCSRDVDRATSVADGPGGDLGAASTGRAWRGCWTRARPPSSAR